VLAGIDHLVDLALNVTELILLSLQLVWMSQLADITRKILNLISIGSTLHLKVIVVFNQSPDLLF